MLLFLVEMERACVNGMSHLGDLLDSELICCSPNIARLDAVNDVLYLEKLHSPEIMNKMSPDTLRRSCESFRDL